MNATFNSFVIMLLINIGKVRLNIPRISSNGERMAAANIITESIPQSTITMHLLPKLCNHYADCSVSNEYYLIVCPCHDVIWVNF